MKPIVTALGGAGDKAVAGTTSWANYTLQGDVEMTSAGSNPNAGVLVRVTNPGVGADALDGYYAGIVTDGTTVLGRETNGWTFLQGGTVPGGVALTTWYHLIIQVSGCTLTVTTQATTSPDQGTMTYTDSGCKLTTGQIGLRTFNAGAAWRFVTVTPLS